MVAVVLVLLPGGVAIEIWRDKLDALEQSCQSEFMKSEQASGASELEIRSAQWHCGRGGRTCGRAIVVELIGSYTEPFVDPKVMLWIWFTRDGRKHYTLATCRFVKIPGSGRARPAPVRQAGRTGTQHPLANVARVPGAFRIAAWIAIGEIAFGGLTRIGDRGYSAAATSANSVA